MGYATVRNVPRITCYKHAKEIHDGIKPLRGRSPELRPLGNRRDADTYSIRMNGDAVECVLYKTPVVTIYPDETVILREAGWSTVSTRQFITRLTGFNAYGKGGKSVVSIDGGDHVIPEDGALTLLRRPAGSLSKYEVVGSALIKAYAMDRAKVTNVRKRYAEFLRYTKNMVKLRTVVETKQSYGGQTFEQTVMTITGEELLNAFGVMTADKAEMFKSMCNSIADPRHRVDARREDSNVKVLREAAEAFYQLHNDMLGIGANTEDEKFKAMQRAFCTLALCAGGYWTGRRVVEQMQSIHDICEGDKQAEYQKLSFAVFPDNFLKLTDNVILKWNAQEILELKEYPYGTVPAQKYRDWMPK